MMEKNNNEQMAHLTVLTSYEQVKTEQSQTKYEEIVRKENRNKSKNTKQTVHSK